MREAISAAFIAASPAPRMQSTPDATSSIANAGNRSSRLLSSARIDGQVLAFEYSELPQFVKERHKIWLLPRATAGEPPP